MPAKLKSDSAEEKVFSYLKARPFFENGSCFYFKSLAVPKKLLDLWWKLNQEHKSIDLAKRYSTFRVDFLNNTVKYSKNDKLILHLAKRILLRGEVTLNSPFVESQLIGSYSYKAKSTYRDYLFSLHSETSFSKCTVDSKNEDKFIEDVLRKIYGSNWHSYVQTQILYSSLIKDGDRDNDQQRVDFLISHKDIKNGTHIIIELDGDEHKDHLEKDKSRDIELEDEKYEILRIKNKKLEIPANLIKELKQKVQEKEARSIEIDEDAKIEILSKAIHEIQISICEGLYQGYYSQNSSFKLVGIYKSGITNKDLELALKIAVDDLNQLLNNLSSLYGRKDIFSLSVNKNNSINISFDEYKNSQIVICPFKFCYSLRGQINDKYTYSEPTNVNEKILKYFLAYIFRFDEFREQQYNACKRLMEKKDSIVLLSTGSGKSLIYQLTSFLVPGKTIVFSPLTSLIDDQVLNLNYQGIDCCVAWHSSKNIKINVEPCDLILDDRFNITYLCPERLMIESSADFFSNINSDIYTVAIDEAHCITEWGHEFRVSYLNVGRDSRKIFKINNRVPVITALTGTASTAVLKDIKRVLEIDKDEAIIVPNNLDRPELSFLMEKASDTEKEKILVKKIRFLQEKNLCTGIVFCRTITNKKNGIIAINNLLKGNFDGKFSGFYGSKVPDGYSSDKWNDLKVQNALDFKNDKIKVLVATNAYGMGIDKPNVNFVIHYGIPTSIESYYQESGRAGRNKCHSECYCLYSPDEKTREILYDESQDFDQRKSKYDSISRKHDDIGTLLFFHFENFSGPKLEKELINRCIYDIFRNKKTNISKDDETEKALYRLKLLNIIEDSKNTTKNEIVITKKIDISKDSIINSYIRYVRSYSESRARLEKEFIDSNINNLKGLDFLCAITNRLIDFVYQTIEEGRWQATRSMVELAEEALKKPANSKEQNEYIHRRVNDYLQVNNSIALNDAINSKTINVDSIKSAFENTNKQKDNELIESFDARSLRGMVTRELDSHPDNPHLLFLRSISEPYCDDANIKDALFYFKKAVDEMDKYSLSNIEKAKILSYCLNAILVKRPENEDIILYAYRKYENNIEIINELIKNKYNKDVSKCIVALRLGRLTNEISNNVKRFLGENI